MALKRWRLAERRKVVGFSQEALAWRLGVDRTTVVRWEIAVTEPLPRLRPKLAQALQVTLEELDELLADIIEVTSQPNVGHAGTPWEEDPTNRRDALKLGFALVAGTVPVPTVPSRLGAADVDRFRASVRSLDALDSHVGGGAVLERALQQLREVHQLLDSAQYNSTTGRRLQGLAGELTNMVGWLAFDAGQEATARRFFVEALAIADVSENAQLKTHVLSSMALQSATSGSGRESVDLTEAAQRAARPVTTPKLSSLLAAREALAYAREGDAQRSGATLATAERLLTEGDDPEDLDWLAGWGRPNIYEAIARAQLLLGQPARAVQAARSALEVVDPTLSRNRAMYQTSLAQALVLAGTVDEGAAVATEAVSCLEAISSGRVRDRLLELRPSLEAHPAVPGVSDCLHRLGRI